MAVGVEHALRASEVLTKRMAVAKPSEEAGHARWAGGKRADVPMPPHCVPTLPAKIQVCVLWAERHTHLYCWWHSGCQNTAPILDLLLTPGEK